MGLAPLADVPVRMLSTGQRKRAALARVIASAAPLWLLDEPLNGLDADGRDRLEAAIAGHRAGGGAILAASHQPLGTRRREDGGAGMIALVIRELRLAATGGAALLPLAFFLLVATLFPFAVGPDGALLARTGGGALWMAALLAALLPVERLVAPDLKDGVLDQLALKGVSEESVALAKLAGHWLSFGPPLMLAAVPAAALMKLPQEVLTRLEIGLAVGTPGSRRADSRRRRFDRGPQPRRRACRTVDAPPGGAAADLRRRLRRARQRDGSAAIAERGLVAAGCRRAVRRRRRDSRYPGLDQRAKIAVGSNRPRASSRTAMSPHSMVPPRSPSVCLQQFADRQRGHADRVNGEDEEAAVGVEQFAAIGDQAGKAFLQPPHLALRPPAEFGRIEDDAVIAPGAPDLARGEFRGVVDQPADRLVRHAGQARHWPCRPRPTSSKHRHG